MSAAVCAALISAACAADVDSFNAADPQAPPTLQDKATVSGVVRLTGRADFSDVTVVLDGVDQGQRTVVTREDGSYDIPDVPAGDYTVSASTPGFRKESVPGINVRLGDVAIRVPDLTLEIASGSIQGQVGVDEGVVAGVIVTLSGIDGDGLPDVADGEVAQALRPTQESPDGGVLPEAPPGEGFFQALTDSAGNYLFPDVPVGQYLLVAQREDLATVCAGVVTIQTDRELRRLGLVRLAPATAVVRAVDDLGRVLTHSNANEAKLELLALNSIDMRVAGPGEDLESLSFEPLQAQVTVALEGDDGPKRFQAQFKDHCELESAVYELVIIRDTQAPTGTATLNDGAVYITEADGAANLRVDARDPGDLSRVVSMRLAIAHSPEDLPLEAGDPFPFLPEQSVGLGAEDAEKEVHVWLIDEAGNESPEPLIARTTKDSTPPRIESFGAEKSNAGVVHARDIVLLIDAAGDPSEVAVVRGETTGANPTRTLFRAEQAWLLPDQDGDYVFTARVWDAAGLASEEVQTTITLDRNGELRGRVLLEGRPDGTLGGCTVSLAGLDGAQLTGDDGSFVFAAVPAGSYDLSASCEGFQSAQLRDLRISAGSAVELEVIRLALARGDITGLVTLEGESRHRGIFISATSGAAEASTFTGDNGAFTLRDLPVGNYTLSASLDGFVTRSEQLTVEADRILELPGVELAVNPGSIAGSVTWEGQSTPEVTLSVNAAGVADQRADAEGAYRFDGLRAGPYTVVASASGYRGAQTAVFVRAGEQTGAPALALVPRRAALRGNVSLSDGASPSGARVELSGTSTIGDDVALVTFAAGDGSFAFSDLLEGEGYRLSVSMVGYERGEILALPPVLEASPPEPVNIELALDAASLSGRVEVEGRDDHAGATITLSGVSTSGLDINAVETSGSDGRFAIAGLPEGNYDLEVALAGFDSERLSVSLRAGRETALPGVIRLSVATGGLRGRIVEELEGGGEGAGIADALVRLQGRSESTFTGADGSYTLANVPAGGPYTLEATRDGYKRLNHTRSVEVVADQVITVETIALEVNPGSIEGTALYEEEGGIPDDACDGGFGHAGIDVAIPGTSVTGVTDCDGRYFLSPVPATALTVQLSAAGRRSVQIDTRVDAGQSVVLSPVTLIRARGTVRGNARLPGAADHSFILVSITVDDTPFTATTNGNGDYVIQDVPAGERSVLAERAGYLPATAPVDVQADAEVTAPDLLLSLDPATVRGVATLQGFADHTGIQISLDAPGVGNVETDDTGAFTFTDVPAGVFTLRASRDHFDAALRTVSVDAGAEVDVTPIVLGVQTGSVLAEVSLDDDGSPSGVVLRLSGQDALGRPLTRAVVADANGRASFDRVPVGSGYVLSASLAGYVDATQTGISVSNGVQTDAPALVLALDPGAVFGAVRLEGRVDHSGVVVTVDRPGTPPAVSDASGAWRIENLPAGTYLVEARADGFGDARALVRVDAGSDSDAGVLRLEAARGSVSGRFLAEGLNDHADTFVTVSGDGGQVTTLTDSDGDFAFADLTTGSYNLSARREGFQGHNAAIEITEDGQLDLGSVTLSVNPGRVEGLAFRDGADDHSGIAVGLQGSGLAQVLTDAEGRYVIDGARAGLYTVVAISDGFEAATTATLVEAGSTSAPAPLTLQPAEGSLRGSVALEDGVAPGGVSLRLTGTGRIQRAVSELQVTASDGSFRFDALLVGEGYTLDISRDGYRSASVRGISINTDTGTVLALETLSIDPGSVTGTVALEGRSDHTGVSVSIDAEGVAPTVSDAAGAFTFAGLRAGRYQLSASRDGFRAAQVEVEVSAGSPATAPAMNLARLRGGASGQVNLQGATDNSGVIVTLTAGADRFSAQSDAAGDWSFNQLPTGSYTLRLERSGYEAHSGNVEVLADNQAVVGLVTLAPIPAPVDGVALLEGAAADGHAGTQISVSAPGVSPVVTGDDGSYLFPTLPAGTYAVTASRAGYREASTVVTSVAGVQTSAQVLELEVARGTISGLVRLAATTDHGGVVVSVGSGAEVISTTTGTDGSFSLARVPAGTRTVTASRGGWLDATATIDVGDGAVADAGTLNLAIIPATITGVVTLEDGANHEGIELSLSLDGFLAVTDQSGAYSFVDVPAGVYTVTARRDGYVSEATTVAAVAGDAADAPAMTLLRARGTLEGNIELAGAASYEGVVINLTGFSFSAVTGPDGSFSIGDVPAEQYELTATRSGYLRATRANVVVPAGGTLTLDPIVLVPQTGDFEIDGGEAFTNGDTVTLSFDDSFAQMRISEDPAFGDTSYVPFAATTQFPLSAGDGAKTIFVQFIDGNSVESQVFSQSITRDSTPPETLSIIIDQGAQFSTDPQARVRLDIEAADATSGVASIEISATGTFTDVFVPFTTNSTLSLPDPATEGERRVYLRARDRAGNSTSTQLDHAEFAPASDTIVLDRTPPQLTAFQINGGAARSSSPLVTLSIESPDAAFMALSNREGFPVLAFEPIEPPTTQRDWFLSSGDGDKSVYLRLRDAAGNLSDEASATITLDTEAPLAPAISVLAGGYTNGNSVDVSLSAEGAFEMRVAVAADLAAAQWVPFAANAQVALPAEEGTVAIAAEFRDRAMNVTPLVQSSVVVDRSPPVGTRVVINDGDAYSRDPGRLVALALQAVDLETGVVSMRISVDGPVDPDTHPAVDYDLSVTRALPAREGNHEVFVSFIDRAGNESPAVSDTIISDTQPPSITRFEINGGDAVTADAQVLLTIEATDAEQMLLTAGADFSGALVEPWVSLAAFELPAGDGDKTVRVRVRDAAGNEANAQDSITLDTTAPTQPTLAIDGGAFVNSRSLQLSLSASGATRVQLGLDPTFAGVASVELAGQLAFELPDEDGNYLVYARYLDDAGNASGTVSASTTLDRVAPDIISVTLDGGAAFSTDPGAQVTLVVSAQDDRSGLGGMRVSSDGALDDESEVAFAASSVIALDTPGSDGERVVRVEARDRAGNASTVAEQRITLDRSAPSIQSFTLDGDAAFTTLAQVTVAIEATGADSMLLSEDDTFAGLSPEPFRALRIEPLDGEGPHTLYLKLLDEAGNEVGPVSRTITVDSVAPSAPSVSIDAGDYSDARQIDLSLSAAGADHVDIATNPSFEGATRSDYQPALSYTLPDADGVYTVYVRYADDAGNQSSVVSDSVTLDRSAPTGASVSIEEGAVSGSRDVTLNLAAVDADLMTIAIDGVVDTEDSEPFATSRAVTLSSGEGDKTIAVVFSDFAGNAAAVVTATIRYDASAPAAPTLTAPADALLTQDRSLTLTFDADAEATQHTLQVAISDAFTTRIVDESTTQTSFDVELADGTWFWRARSADAAGNTSAFSAVRSFTIDTEAPRTPTLDSFGAAPINELRPTFSWQSESATGAVSYHLQVATDAAFTNLVVDTDVAGTSYVHGADFGPGDYFFQVNATDAAGNTSPYNDSAGQVTLDLEAPGTPVLEPVSPAALTNSQAVTLHWLAAGGAVDYRVMVSAVPDFSTSVFVDTRVGDVRSHTVSLAEGEWYYRVQGFDAANNTGAWTWEAGGPPPPSFEIDLSAPSAPTITPAIASPGNDTSPALAWTAEAASEPSGYLLQLADDPSFDADDAGIIVCELSLSAPSYGFDFAGGEPRCTALDATANLLAEGTWHARVASRDGAGNQSAYSAVERFIVDLTAPGVPTPVAVATPTNDATPLLSWTAASDALSGVAHYEVEVWDNDQYLPAGGAEAELQSETTSLEVQPPLFGDTTWYWRLRAVDAAGNPGAFVDGGSFALDTQPPVGPLLDPVSGNGYIADTTPTLSWTAGDADSVDFRVELSNAPNFAVVLASAQSTAGAESFTVDADDALADGEYYWRVAAIDAAGNVAPFTTGPSFFVDTAAPTVTSVALAESSPHRTRDVTLLIEAEGAFQMRVAMDGTLDTENYEPFAASSPRSFPGGTEGAATVAVELRDRAFNNTAVQQASITIDTLAPVAPVITATDPAPRQGSSISLAWAAVGDAVSYILQVSVGDAFVTPLVDVETTALTGDVNLQDGSYHWRVFAIDAAGNRSPASTTGRFTLDNLAPRTPVLLGFDGPTRNQRPTFRWQSEAASGAETYTIEIAADSSFATVDITVPDITGTQFTPVSNVAHGTWYFRVRAEDAAGNESDNPSAPESVVIDTQAPDAPANLDMQPGTPTRQNTISLSWDASASASEYQLQLADTNTFTGVSVTSLVQTATSLTTTLSEDVYFWRVRARDDAGNESAFSATQTFTIDNTSPDQPSAPFVAPNPVASATPRIQWSDESATGANRYELQLSDNAQLFRDGATVWCALLVSDNDYQFDFAGGDPRCDGALGFGDDLSDGTWYVRVRAEDSVGNWSELSTINSFVVDTTAPVPVSVLINDDAALAARVQVDLTIEATGADEIALACDGTNYGPPRPYATSERCDLPAGDGAKTVCVRFSDLAGNTATLCDDITLDESVPTVPTSVDTGSPINDDPVTLSWGAVAGAVSYRLTVATSPGFGDLVVDETTDQLSYDYSPDAEQRYWWNVIAISANGLESMPAMRNFEWDATAPTDPEELQPEADAVIKDSTPRLVFDPPAGGPDGAVSATLTVSCDTQSFTRVLATPVSHYDWGTGGEGAITDGEECEWGVAANDAAGNSSTTSRISFFMDLTPYAVPSNLSPPGGTVTPGQRPMLSWDSVAPGALYDVELIDAGDAVVVSQRVSVTTYVTNLVLADGVYRWRVRSIDPAGNESAFTSYQAVTVDTVAPDAPTPVDPSPSQVVATRRPTFSWLAGADAVRYHLVIRRASTGAITGDIDNIPTNSFPLDVDLAETDWLFHVAAYDAANNKSAFSAPVPFSVDVTAPLNPSVTIESGDHTRVRDLVLLLSAQGASELRVSEDDMTFTGSQWQPYTERLAYTLAGAEGSHTLYVQFRDDADNPTTPVTAQVDFDETAPILGTPSFRINSGADSTGSALVSLNLRAAGGLLPTVNEASSHRPLRIPDGDAGGVASTLRVEGGAACEEVFDFSVSVDISHDDIGELVVFLSIPSGRDYRLHSNGGAGTTRLLTTYPSPTAPVDDFENAFGSRAGGDWVVTVIDRSPGNDGELNRVSLAVRCFEPGHRLEMKVSEDSGLADASWEPYRSTQNFVLTSSEGTKTVYAQLRDEAGNTTAILEDDIELDTTVPTGGVVLLNGGAEFTTSRDVTLTFWIGGEATQYSTSGFSWVNCSGGACAEASPGEDHNLRLSTGDGIKPVSVFFRDAARNVSSQFQTTIELDTTPPTDVEILTVAPRTTSAFVDIEESTDNGSGVDHYVVEVRDDQGALVKTTTFPNSEGWVTDLPSLRNYSFRARAVDAAGLSSNLSTPVGTLVGMSAALVGSPDLTNTISEPISYRGFYLHPRQDGTHMILTTCDARQGRCRDSGLIESKRDLWSGAGGLKAVSLSVQGDTLWFFGVRDDGTANRQLELLRYKGDPNGISDLSNWTYHALGNHSPTIFTGTLRSATNGRSLVLGWWEGTRTLAVRTCELSGDCTDPTSWTTRALIVDDEAEWALQISTFSWSMDAGEDHFWLSYPQIDRTVGGSCGTSGACGFAVFGCTARNGCESNSDWYQVSLRPVNGYARAARVLEVDKRLYVAGITDVNGGLPTMYLFRCNANSATSNRCTSAAQFGSPLALHQVNMSSRFAVLVLIPPRISFDWWAGRLHFAMADYSTGVVSYGTCNDTADDCLQASAWDKAEVLQNPAVDGQADLRVVQGNPLLIMGRNDSFSYVLEPEAPAPLGRALVPDSLTGGVRASFSPQAPDTADGHRASYNDTGYLDERDQTAVIADPGASGVEVTDVKGQDVYGAVTSFAEQDSSISEPLFHARGGGLYEGDDAIDAFPILRYASSTNCNAVAYQTEAEVVKVLTCAKSDDCSQNSNWNNYTWAQRGTDDIKDLGMAVTSSRLHLVLAWDDEPEHLQSYWRTIASDCTMNMGESAHSVVVQSGTGTPALDVDPGYVSVAATTSRLFIAWARDWSAFNDETSDMYFAECLLSTGCDSSSEFDLTSWDFQYFGGPLTIASSYVYWSPRYDDDTNTRVRSWRCWQSANCDSAADWSSSFKHDLLPSAEDTANLTYSGGKVLYSTGPYIAWCNENLGCSDGDEWNRGFVGLDVVGDTSDNRHAVFTYQGGEWVHVGVGTGGISVARCQGRCWQPDNWIGGFADTDARGQFLVLPFTNSNGPIGEVESDGDINLLYRYESLVDQGEQHFMFMQNARFDYLTP